MNRQLIREKFLERKERYGYSLREIADESGVSPSTLSRFQRNVSPEDAETLARIAVWAEVDNFSGGMVCDGKTLDNVQRAILSDETLTDDGKDRLFRLFSSMYACLIDGGEKLENDINRL